MNNGADYELRFIYEHENASVTDVFIPGRRDVFKNFRALCILVVWYEYRRYLNNEPVRTDTNSNCVGSYEFVLVRC